MVQVDRFTVAGMDEMSAGLGREFTVVFDGDCRVCTRLSEILRKWDRERRLEVVSSQTPGLILRFPWIPPRAYAEALQLVRLDGTTWQGASAIEELLNILPRGKLISWIFAIPFMRILADRFYKSFARNRYRLGCGTHGRIRPPAVTREEAERGLCRREGR